ncbi:MAG: hypothetical protein A2504_12820 [Bdellovibrionales bacterium RIFOXYD12_FULL_39_22]|nr:MAG: hypothetical protein A2385_03905 [Bdellovibrionales bacterium RIFOXYB1_FULL_39_21]OFZ40497.1 MAG: hypothetical protein A2485_02770 [Bdellovibrionales bacterium RIFOXYC12_FULL_39_17]OFZ49980.1 MAG: hypothetical protein A2404_02105 [Bdellovibrionales bacterium RIFOXYC1_FULL_39_130]OFZ77622.1 MAG: hypothetical protein A2560_04665 [Bdellovibrionales bacterium RIFOXYD1_FULL_39_84]OFZ96076.1 MAG: hypothetical protein A2504_12820 [Bdellovibrionales bacterium RIFOXYD12_FULL_39_22]HLE10635.1 hy
MMDKVRQPKFLWWCYEVVLFIYLIWSVVKITLDSIYSFEKILILLSLFKITPIILLFFFLLLGKRRANFIWKAIAIVYSILLLLLPLHVVTIGKFLFPEASSSLNVISENLDLMWVAAERVLILPALLLIIYYSFSKKDSELFMQEILENLKGKAAKIFLAIVLLSLTVSLPLLISYHVKEKAFAMANPEIHYPLRKFILDCSSGESQKFVNEEQYKAAFGMDSKTFLQFVVAACDCLSDGVAQARLFENSKQDDRPLSAPEQFLNRSRQLGEFYNSKNGQIMIMSCLEKNGMRQDIQWPLPTN